MLLQLFATIVFFKQVDVKSYPYLKHGRTELIF